MLKTSASSMSKERKLRVEVILIVVICAASIVTLEPNNLAYGQENISATLKEIQTTQSNQSAEIGAIKNTTSSQKEVFEKIGTTLSKSATQGAYTALSVFFLGIALVVLGLRMSLKAAAPNFGRYFNLMIWALTIPVLVLIVMFQLGIATGNKIMLYATDEPYLVISFLLYIPLGIIIFLLVTHGKMARQQQ
jgi:preprotein translocase subunit SecF